VPVGVPPGTGLRNTGEPPHIFPFTAFRVAVMLESIPESHILDRETPVL